MVLQAYSCIGSAIIIANLAPGNISQDVKFNSSLEDVFLSACNESVYIRQLHWYGLRH